MSFNVDNIWFIHVKTQVCSICSPGGSRIHLPMQETRVQSLGQEDPLEKEMATHFSVLAWEIPWTKRTWQFQSMGSQRVRHDLETCYLVGHD